MATMATKRTATARSKPTRARTVKPEVVPTTIDDYLAPLPAPHRAALEHVRKAIRAAVPRAEEGISYQMPAFRLDGRWFIWFGAAARHCALYGISAADADLRAYDTGGRGTLRFAPDDPPPASLIKKLVKGRIAKR